MKVPDAPKLSPPPIETANVSSGTSSKAKGDKKSQKYPKPYYSTQSRFSALEVLRVLYFVMGILSLVGACVGLVMLGRPGSVGIILLIGGVLNAVSCFGLAEGVRIVLAMEESMRHSTMLLKRIATKLDEMQDRK